MEGVHLGEHELARDFSVAPYGWHGLDLAGILAFHASPVWVLAALADLSGAGRGLIGEITDSLKDAGLLERGEVFETMDEVLDGLERSTGKLADTVTMPPLDVPALRREWLAVSYHLASIPPRQLPPIEFLVRVWGEIGERSRREHHTVFEVSSLMALAAVAELPIASCELSKGPCWRCDGENRRISPNRCWSIMRPRSKRWRRWGLLEFWLRQFRPYLRAAAANFAPGGRLLTTKTVPARGSAADSLPCCRCGIIVSSRLHWSVTPGGARPIQCRPHPVEQVGWREGLLEQLQAAFGTGSHRLELPDMSSTAAAGPAGREAFRQFLAAHFGHHRGRSVAVGWAPGAPRPLHSPRVRSGLPAPCSRTPQHLTHVNGAPPVRPRPVAPFPDPESAPPEPDRTRKPPLLRPLEADAERSAMPPIAIYQMEPPLCWTMPKRLPGPVGALAGSFGSEERFERCAP